MLRFCKVLVLNAPLGSSPEGFGSRPSECPLVGCRNEGMLPKGATTASRLEPWSRPTRSLNVFLNFDYIVGL